MQAGPCGFRGADIGAHRDVHADIARDARQHRAQAEAGRRDRRSHPIEEDPDKGQHDDADDCNGAVLPAEIGLRAFLDCGGDVLHLLVAGGRLEHLTAGNQAIEHGEHAADHGRINDHHG